VRAWCSGDREENQTVEQSQSQCSVRYRVYERERTRARVGGDDACVRKHRAETAACEISAEAAPSAITLWLKHTLVNLVKCLHTFELGRCHDRQHHVTSDTTLATMIRQYSRGMQAHAWRCAGWVAVRIGARTPVIFRRSQP
jgi:hypothetical protein